MRNALQQTVFGLILLTASINGGLQASTHSYHNQDINTNAGHIDFSFIQRIRHPEAYHKISYLAFDDQAVELENGSAWHISKPDAVRGWEKSEKVVLTQNHTALSTCRFALVNLDLKLAVPVSLVREPIPGSKNSFYIKQIDLANDIIDLSDGKRWIVNSSDKRILNKLTKHDRMIIGVNTSDTADKSPYILIDTANNTFVRASILE